MFSVASVLFSSVVAFSSVVVFSSVVLFSVFTYVLLISSNLFFPSLLNAISKYTDVPDVALLYNTFDDSIELLSNKTSFV